MNNTNLPCSLDDTTELRKLIIGNPDLPLVVFCSEECNSGDWYYEWTEYAMGNKNIKLTFSEEEI